MGVFTTLRTTVLFFTIIAVNTGVPAKADPVEDIFNASRDGYLAEVKRLAAGDQCRNVNTRYGKYNRSPLHAAVEGNHTQVVEFLLNCSANVNARDGCGVTPLIAAENSILAVVNSLMASNPELDIKYTGGRGCEGTIGETALMGASLYSTPEVVRALIEAGANVNIRDIDGETALMWASLDNRTETLDIVNILLSANADLDTQSTGGPDYGGTVGTTALMYASLFSTPEVVRTLVSAGANVYIRDSHGKTALIWAFLGNRTETLDIVNILISANADLDTQTTGGPDYEGTVGTTALMYASLHSTPEVVRALVSAGVNVNIRDINGETALMWASGSNRPEELDIVNALISENPDLDTQTTGGPDYEGTVGATALMQASIYSTPELVRTLVEAGANVNIKDIDSHTALMWASLDNRTETLDIVNILISANADLDTQTTGGPDYEGTVGTTALMYASFHSTPDVVRALVSAGANVDIRDSRGQIALHWASGSNRPEELDIVNALISANPDLDTQSTGGPGYKGFIGATALMQASLLSIPEVVRALVKAGANRNLRDSDGFTALKWAADNKKHKEEIQDILLSSPNAEGNGATPSQVITINSVMMTAVILLITRTISP